MRHLPILLTLAISAAAWAEAPSTIPPPPATTSRPVAIAPDPAAEAIRALLPRLGNSDYATRTAAQKDLDQLDYHALPALRQLAATSTDDEVKIRLLTRAGALAECGTVLVEQPSITQPGFPVEPAARGIDVSVDERGPGPQAPADASTTEHQPGVQPGQ